jgi:hypothetical protein
MQQADTFQPQDIGNFMRIHKDGSGAAGYYGGTKAAHRYHAAFHVDVAVQEPGRQISSVCVNYYCFRPDGMGGIADQGYPAAGDGHIAVGDNFSSMDVDQPGAANNEISRFAAHGNGN